MISECHSSLLFPQPLPCPNGVSNLHPPISHLSLLAENHVVYGRDTDNLLLLDLLLMFQTWCALFIYSIDPSLKSNDLYMPLEEHNIADDPRTRSMDRSAVDAHAEPPMRLTMVAQSKTFKRRK